jgi:hypothetical protein
MNIQVIKTTFNEKWEEILTQCILIAEEILLIHPYIPPRVSRHDRNTYWRDMQAFTDSWSLNNPSYKIVISGDLNTRDIRFGESHSENHTYMDRILADLEIISDKRVPTREGNTLDVTLGNLQAKNSFVRSKVIEKLSSDHSPTNTEISLTNSPYKDNSREYKNCRIFTVMDVQKTRTRISIAVSQMDSAEVTLTQVNETLADAAIYKTMRHRPIKFWTTKLKDAMR